jgi:hypothetical protein
MKGVHADRHEATNQHQPTAEMHTDAHSDVETQHRTAQTKREQQDDVIHRPGDDLMGLDQAGRLLLGLEVKGGAALHSLSLPVTRPTHSWKQRVVCHAW